MTDKFYKQCKCHCAAEKDRNQKQSESDYSPFWQTQNEDLDSNSRDFKYSRKFTYQDKQKQLKNHQFAKFQGKIEANNLRIDQLQAKFTQLRDTLMRQPPSIRQGDSQETIKISEMQMGLQNLKHDVFELNQKVQAMKQRKKPKENVEIHGNLNTRGDVNLSVLSPSKFHANIKVISPSKTKTINHIRRRFSGSARKYTEKLPNIIAMVELRK